MDFILICAPSYKKYTSGKAESDKDDPLTLPMGGLFIAEELIRRGITVAIVHGEIQEIIQKIDRLAANDTVAFGISTLSGDMLKQAMLIARNIRRNHPDKPIIWGGIHPTAVREQTLRHPLVDYIVWGEGEFVLPKLLEAIRTGKGFEKIKGIGYKTGRHTYVTGLSDYTPLGRIFDLPYHLLDINRYLRKMLIGGDRWLPVMTSRGCPFGCKFCNNSSSTYPNTKVRFHTLDHILSNISLLVDKYDVDAIGFDDELTAVDDKRIVDLCHALRSLNRSLTYRISSRVDVIARLSDSTLRLMRDTGFVAVGYGIESGSQRILDFIGKNITIKQIMDADKRLTEFGFYKSYNFMIGLPTETIQEMKMTLRLLVKLARNSKYCPYPCSQVPAYVPLPDTELFLIAQKHGFRPPQDLEGWVDLDSHYVEETRNRIRPWLTQDLAAFAAKANKMVSEISTHFTGRCVDQDEIDSLLDELEQFAS